MERVKALSMILITVAVIFFAGQNLDSVEVTFLFWTFHVPLSLITLVPLLVGLVVGLIGTAVVIKRRERRDQPEAVVAPGSELAPEQLQAPSPEADSEAESGSEEELAT